MIHHQHLKLHLPLHQPESQFVLEGRCGNIDQGVLHSRSVSIDLGRIPSLARGKVWSQIQLEIIMSVKSGLIQDGGFQSARNNVGQPRHGHLVALEDQGRRRSSSLRLLLPRG